MPHYSTLSRRSERLEVLLENINWTQPIHILIDASGLKVFGEGEWKMRVHGKDKRRTWRKIHIGIDRKTQEIVALDITLSNVHDSKRTASLIEQVEKIASVTGDKEAQKAGQRSQNRSQDTQQNDPPWNARLIQNIES